MPSVQRRICWPCCASPRRSEAMCPLLRRWLDIRVLHPMGAVHAVLLADSHNLWKRCCSARSIAVPDQPERRNIPWPRWTSQTGLSTKTSALENSNQLAS